MKKLIIFGGSFDPIHKGHIEIAKRAFNKIKANKLIFVPCKNHPDGKILSATDEQRYQMIRLAIKSFPYFEVSRFEIDRKDVSYTIETINQFKQDYKDYQLYLLIGYDQLISFETWYKYDEILDNVKIICHPRRVDESKEKEIKFPFIDLKYLNVNTSSSELRVRPKRKYLDPKVLQYINDNAIYAKDRLIDFGISEYRINHCLRVAKLAKEIAKSLKYYTLLNKAYVAGIYHDYAKEIPKEECLKYARKLKIKNYVNWKVLHGPIAAYLVEKKFLFEDYQVITAIRHHVQAIGDFSTLTKIVFCADKLDVRKDGEIENRKKLLQLCKKDLNAGFEAIKKVLEKIYGDEK